MQNIPYPSAVGSLMYAQICTRPDITFAVSMLGRYQSNSGIIHWRATKKVLRPLRIYCDNSAAVFMAKNNRSSSRSKHIDIKYLAIKDRVRSNEVQIEHMSTKQMIADLLTKGMPPELLKDHVTSMGLCSVMSLI
ncbi:hypothetical protein AAHE18_01G039700 [Arachis hypogaea]